MAHAGGLIAVRRLLIQPSPSFVELCVNTTTKHPTAGSPVVIIYVDPINGAARLTQLVGEVNSCQRHYLSLCAICLAYLDLYRQTVLSAKSLAFITNSFTLTSTFTLLQRMHPLYSILYSHRLLESHPAWAKVSHDGAFCAILVTGPVNTNQARGASINSFCKCPLNTVGVHRSQIIRLHLCKDSSVLSGSTRIEPCRSSLAALPFRWIVACVLKKIPKYTERAERTSRLNQET